MTIRSGPGGGVIDNGVHYIFRQMTDYVDGRVYSDWAPHVKQMKREGRDDEAERLCLRICDAMEAGEQSVAPWYYEQIAIIRRKRRAVAGEIAILERYEKQRKAPGVKPAKLAARLSALRRRVPR